MENSKLQKLLLLIFIMAILSERVIPIGNQYIFISIAILMIFRKLYLDSIADLQISKNTVLLTMWFLLFITMSILQLFYVDEMYRTIQYLYAFISGLIAYYTLTLLIKEKEHLIWFVKTLIILTTIISCITIFNHINFWLTGTNASGFLSDSARGIGLFFNPNYYAVSLLMSLSLILGMKNFNEISKKNKLLYSFMFTILSLDLFMTYSRSAIVAYGLTLILYFLINVNIKNRLKPTSILKVIFLIPLTLSALMYSVSRINFLQNIFQNVSQRFIDAGESSRFDMWSNGYSLFRSEVLYTIMGVGGNQFVNFTEFGIHTSPHNGFLRFLYEGGFIGAILLIMLLLFLFTRVFNLKKLRITSPFFIALTAMIFISLGNDMFEVRSFWIIASLILIWDNILKNSE